MPWADPVSSQYESARRLRGFGRRPGWSMCRSQQPHWSISWGQKGIGPKPSKRRQRRKVLSLLVFSCLVYFLYWSAPCWRTACTLFAALVLTSRAPFLITLWRWGCSKTASSPLCVRIRFDFVITYFFLFLINVSLLEIDCPNPRGTRKLLQVRFEQQSRFGSLGAPVGFGDRVRRRS